MPVYNLTAQQDESMLYIRGSVRESDTYEPISKVNIEINGGAYTITDSQGRFYYKSQKRR